MCSTHSHCSSHCRAVVTESSHVAVMQWYVVTDLTQCLYIVAGTNRVSRIFDESGQYSGSPLLHIRHHFPRQLARYFFAFVALTYRAIASVANQSSLFLQYCSSSPIYCWRWVSSQSPHLKGGVFDNRLKPLSNPTCIRLLKDSNNADYADREDSITVNGAWIQGSNSCGVLQDLYNVFLAINCYFGV